MFFLIPLTLSSIKLLSISCLSVFLPLGSPILAVAPPTLKLVLFELNQKIIPKNVPAQWVDVLLAANAVNLLKQANFQRVNYRLLGQSLHKQSGVCYSVYQ